MEVCSAQIRIRGTRLRLGAVPFHPENQQPRAACPRCVKDKGDDSLKDLFAIQGLSEGQYDSTIPEMWMHCPAIKLDDSIEGMDAVRVSFPSSSFKCLNLSVTFTVSVYGTVRLRQRGAKALEYRDAEGLQCRSGSHRRAQNPQAAAV